MKKILVSMFLLAFGLCLVGCVHSTYEYQFHFYVDGGNGTISIETSSSFNPNVKMCKDVEDMCNLDCTIESYFVKLNSGEKGSREITFIATPNTGYQVKEWLFNGEIVEGNKTNSFFTAIVTSEEDYIGVISVRFEEIICNHQWDEGRETDGGNGGYVMKYICELCGNIKEETITIIPPQDCPYEYLITEEGHLINMLCDCCDDPAVEEPHKDLDKNQTCDECGYVFDTTGINGMYTPELLASLDILKPIEKGNEILEDFSLWIQSDILYINSSIFANGKIGEFTLSEREKLSDEYSLDEFDYVNDEAKDLVKELFEQESYYAIAILSYPESVPGHYLIELNGDLYYVYTLFTLGVNGSKDTVLVFKLNK